MSENIVTVPPGADYFTIERSFVAPRPLVWKCYTEPQHLVRFWGPREATCDVTVDLRVGGLWRTQWTYPSGHVYAYGSVYLEIAEPEKLHYRDAPSDWRGGLDELPPPELISTISLSQRGGETTVVAHIQAVSVALRDETVARGFAGMVSLGNDRLTDYLATLIEEGAL